MRIAPMRLWGRGIKFLYQRLTRGFSDKETWSLDSTIARFVLPRLIRFKTVANGYPGTMTEEQWDVILDKMIWSFDSIVKDNVPTTNREDILKHFERQQEGLNLFGEHFRSLWW